MRLWRLFWLCRARRAMSLLPSEKREVECWTIDRDLCEVMGDTLYGLSRHLTEASISFISRLYVFVTILHSILLK